MNEERLHKLIKQIIAKTKKQEVSWEKTGTYYRAPFETKLSKTDFVLSITVDSNYGQNLDGEKAYLSIYKTKSLKDDTNDWIFDFTPLEGKKVQTKTDSLVQDLYKEVMSNRSIVKEAVVALEKAFK